MKNKENRKFSNFSFIKKPCRLVVGFFDSQKNTRVTKPQHKCRGFFLGLKIAD